MNDMEPVPWSDIMGISPSQSMSPLTPKSPGYSRRVELEYIDMRLRQHQQHLPSPNLPSPPNKTTPQPSDLEDIPTPLIITSHFANWQLRIQ